MSFAGGFQQLQFFPNDYIFFFFFTEKLCVCGGWGGGGVGHVLPVLVNLKYHVTLHISFP